MDINKLSPNLTMHLKDKLSDTLNGSDQKFTSVFFGYVAVTVISIPGVLLNLLVIVVSCHVPTLQRSHKLVYYISLAFADLLFGLGGVTHLVRHVTIRDTDVSFAYCVISHGVSAVCLFTSLIILALMSGEQYLCLRYPISWRQYKNRFYKILSSVSVWVCVSCLTIIPTVTEIKASATVDECWIDDAYDFEVMKLIFVPLFHLNMLGIVFINIAVLWTLRRAHRSRLDMLTANHEQRESKTVEQEVEQEMELMPSAHLERSANVTGNNSAVGVNDQSCPKWISGSPSSALKETVRTHRRGYRKSFLTVSLYTAIFAVCTCPYFYTLTVGLACPKCWGSASEKPCVRVVLAVLFYVKATINPIIYTFRFAMFRNSVKCCFKR